MNNFLEIDSTSGLKQSVKQALKFKTGKFIWQVRFNTPLDPRTVNSQNMYVTSDDQSLLKTSIQYDSMKNEINIEPLEAYAQEKTYTLHITKNVKSKGGKNLNENVTVQFHL